MPTQKRRINRVKPNVKWQNQKYENKTTNDPTETAQNNFFSSDFLKKILLYGSQPVNPGWIKKLSNKEQQVALSITAKSQAVPTVNVSTPLPEKAGLLLPVLQLFTLVNPLWSHTNHSMQTLLTKNPLLKNETFSTETRNTYELRQGIEPVLHFSTPIKNITLARYRREPSTSAIEDEYIPNSIQNLLNNEQYPAKIINQIDIIFRTAETSPEVKNSNLAELKNTNLLLKCMKLTSALLNEYLNKQDLNDTYLFLQLILQDFWNIANQLSSLHSKNAVAQYKALLYQEKVNRRKKELITHSLSRDELIIANYIMLKHVEWSNQGINGEEKVVIITSNEAKIFLISQILNKEQRKLIENKSISCRFLFDTSGLSDNELTEFVLTTLDTNDFNEYKNTILTFLHKKANQVHALDLFQKSLSSWIHTPLYFQSYQAIQDLIDDQLGALAPKLEPDREYKELIVALINLAIGSSARFALEQATLIYANSLLMKFSSVYFAEFNIPKLLHTDFIYHYQDQSGHDKFSTTLLAEYLSIDTPSPNIEITKRQKINMLWPANFSVDQIAFLEKKRKMVSIFSEKLRLAQQLAQLKHDLLRAMPSFITQLEQLQIDLCKKLSISHSRLEDTFEFIYTAETLITEMRAALQFSYPPQHKQFTIGEILIGRQREWESKNYNYNVKKVSTAPKTIPKEKINDFVNNLNELLTQDILINSLQIQKKDLLLKNHYNLYVNLLIAYVNWSPSSIHQFAQTPLLLVYPNSPHTSVSNQLEEKQYHFIPKFGYFYTSINLSKPIQVMSLVSGKTHDFNSLVDMKRQLTENEELGKYFKSHLPVDFGDDFSTVKVVQRSLQGDPFEQLIDWQIENFDKIIKSQMETETFEILSGVSLILSLPAMALNPIAEFSYNVLLSAGPKLLQAAISDMKQERDSLLKEAIIQLASETLSEIAVQSISVFILNSIKTIAKHPKIRLKIGANTLNAHDPALDYLHSDVHMHCPKHHKRGILDTFCTFFRTRSNTPNEHIPTSVEASPFQEPLRTISEHYSKTLPPDIQEYVHQMMRDPKFTTMIKTPDSQCINMVRLVENFLKMKESDAQILYRGVLIWDDLDNTSIPSPQNHFAVVYKKGDKSYVFDLTAGQFADKGLPDLNAPLTVPEETWIALYQASRKR